ncbi:hypothetical protein BDB01DRAFT_814709 [Pilobolus umbonatus]|nr:hypothetical protein BDB01DRAFT_814709 [Pilobolus umbonatus]
MKYILAFVMFISAVFAQISPPGIYITFPVIGNILRQGSSYNITWQANDLPPELTIDSIALRNGSATSLGFAIQNILTEPIPASYLTYNWTVPEYLFPDTNYALSFFDSEGITTYSGFFTIA